LARARADLNRFQLAGDPIRESVRRQVLPNRTQGANLRFSARSPGHVSQIPCMGSDVPFANQT
jgi:hypothetical protein